MCTFTFLSLTFTFNIHFGFYLLLLFSCQTRPLRSNTHFLFTSTRAKPRSTSVALLMTSRLVQRMLTHTFSLATADTIITTPAMPVMLWSSGAALPLHCCALWGNRPERHNSREDMSVCVLQVEVWMSVCVYLWLFVSRAVFHTLLPVYCPSSLSLLIPFPQSAAFP